jgi:hypothetical protein
MCGADRSVRSAAVASLEARTDHVEDIQMDPEKAGWESGYWTYWGQGGRSGRLL